MNNLEAVIGREITSDTRGPQFESSHRQMIHVRIPFKPRVFSVKFVLEKNENKKEVVVGQLLKIISPYTRGGNC